MVPNCKSKLVLEQLLAMGSGAAFYEYDFGDSWLHRLDWFPAGRQPASRGPLEDSGGFPGHEEIMDALANPSHPDHAEYAAWVAGLTGSDRPLIPPSWITPP